MNDEQKGQILAAFFFAYALGQVPAGWLADRYGARRMMPIYIGLWSLCTLLTGFANGLVMFLVLRFIFGLAQAGCYPTAGSLLKRWTPPPVRGTASGIVSFGGRLGGALAPVLTAWLLEEYLGWRTVLTLYGCSGFLVALLFWKLFRESPAVHLGCNNAERSLITAGELENTPTVRPPFPPLMPLIRSRTMWLMCALQFGINFGWAFIITWLPTYLDEVRMVEEKTSGVMSTVVLCAGIVGMLCGGPVSDLAKKRLGLKWGPSLLLLSCYLIALIAYLVSARIDSAWGFIVAISLVAFCTDLSVPAIWAYMQDVGGNNTAAVFGWGNMWGNFGGGVVVLLVPTVRRLWDHNGDWHEVFLLFSLGYLIAGLAALGINANRKIA